ncbi:MAG: GNAT family N-acetyltransferase [Alphaproteobacteria bacterium]|nr:GNAT family N-acetyltransferase [Alphaproteobacteria bacterium]
MTETSGITVRFAERDDLDALAAIYAESFDDMQPRLAVEQYLRPPGTWALIALVHEPPHEMPAGFILTRNAADEAEIFSIGVARAFRRRGVGLALLDAMDGVAGVRGARTIYLEVGVDNRAARALYSKAGYEIIGERPDYYRNPGGNRVTALVLRRHLENIENRDSS